MVHPNQHQSPNNYSQQDLHASMPRKEFIDKTNNYRSVMSLIHRNSNYLISMSHD